MLARDAARRNGTGAEVRTDAVPVRDFVGYSLANLSELVFGCLEAAGAKTVAEVGAFEGLLTGALLEWAGTAGATITAIDAEPPPALRALAARHPELRLVDQPSPGALRDLPEQDALIIDGDHNYFTVSEEVRTIADRAQGGRLPLLLFHDVAWPHARRDTYYEPDRIPPEHRQPLAADARLHPEEPGVAEHGIGYSWAAAREGGPRNGVLTALEDFVGESENLRLVVVPAFFGLGAIWDLGAPWSADVAAILDPWDRNPIVARLEANRVAHLVKALGAQQAGEAASEALRTTSEALESEQSLRAQREEMLRVMLNSRAFAVAEQLSRLHQRGRPVFSREQIRSELANGDGPQPDRA